NDLLFDHANDHLPAMVLVEAAQQAAHLHTPGRRFTPSASEMRFTRYIEFHTPCLITTHPHTTPHNTTITITGHQNNQPAFTIRLTQPTTP
ncbi:AfsA-related hotdog domain-containing protein, partial [Streptomyces sp. NPDC005574]|uniref:AfsA-related hotdog domain-containing protein n=1 Tax=Streptomyces sp. NPDC005574 TaxID=3156891 RepID=UPI0033B28C7F